MSSPFRAFRRDKDKAGELSASKSSRKLNVKGAPSRHSFPQQSTPKKKTGVESSVAPTPGGKVESGSTSTHGSGTQTRQEKGHHRKPSHDSGTGSRSSHSTASSSHQQHHTPSRNGRSSEGKGKKIARSSGLPPAPRRQTQQPSESSPPRSTTLTAASTVEGSSSPSPGRNNTAQHHLLAMQQAAVREEEQMAPKRTIASPQMLNGPLSPAMKAAKSSVKHAIEDLNKAIGHDRRIAAITNACEEFDHWKTEKHDLELSLGAANVLSLVLSMTDNDDEIRMICAALEMVYRGSHDVVAKSFTEVGAAVVPLLLRLLERCESGNMRNADVSIMNITKVLLYFSRVPSLRLPLVRHQGLLQALTRVATSILTADSRVVRMRVLANLANAEVNRVTMFEHSGLVESVVKIASLDLSDSAREYAAAAIMDLAGAPLNQGHMARNDKLLSTLVRLAVTDPKSETRDYAVTALQNLAFLKENRARLAQYCNGVVLEALKTLLTSEDQNDKSRRRAAGALTNLACDETAETLGQHKGLLDVLASVSVSDRSADVQKRASLALTKIANSITSTMPCHSTLLSSLVKASQGANGTHVAGVFRAKARIVENRYSMARHPELLETLARICTDELSSLKDREDAMRALMHLTNDNSNREMMANKDMLDTLVASAALPGVNPEERAIRDSAVTAIERLATEVSNRKIMARHEGLLVAVAMAVEREASAPETNQRARLAKPLLMSLLVAM